MDAAKEKAKADKSTPDAALLLIDFINAMDFEGAEALRPEARRAAQAALALRAQADALGIPVVYVNDNYGHWRSEKSAIIDKCREATEGARELVDIIAPRDSDYFVIKPQFSGFYATNLPVLLPKLGARRLILTGLVAEICVLFTAADAHMRAYDLWVPKDCTASLDAREKSWVLSMMGDSMKAQTAPTSDMSLADWLKDEAAS